MGDLGIDLVATVPDAGLSRLLTLCEDDPAVDVITLTTEEEGVGLLAGAWLGGRRAVLMMQSSGIGNIVNALTLPGVCGIPCLMLATMRGQDGEFNPWQVPMGTRGPRVLAELGVTCRDVEDAAAVAPAFAAAAEAAYGQGRAEAVLVAQSVIGTKSFER
ncbi:MAG: phosphonopyruvate decarboxylase [Hyphomicrobiales bacterium]|nr:phosphonopyruvate decarboxylase [Hyphomicrobiales bacterium]MCP5371696.1 phosphonopyruvate decarboxylase [Hyphomicrobiales bacterium]